MNSVQGTLAGEPTDNVFPIFPVSKEARRFRLYLLLIFGDLLCVFAGFISASPLRVDTSFTLAGLRVALLVSPIYLFVALNGGAYEYDTLVNRNLGLKRALTAIIIAVMIVLFVAYYVQLLDAFSQMVMSAGTALVAIFLIMHHFWFDRFAKRQLGGNPRAELVILDGGDAIAPEGATTIQASAFNIRPDLTDPHMLDRFGALVRNADYVLVSCRSEDRAQWSRLLKGTNINGHILAPEFEEIGAYQLAKHEEHYVLRVSSGPLDLRNRMVKRSVDLALAIPSLILVAPLFVLVAIAIKLDTRGPVFFRQRRMGFQNRLFDVWKFRSMRHEARDSAGDRSASCDDDRITRVGRFLRRTSIDELPQLINVVQGSMSLVGPRPHALGSLAGADHFWEIDHQYWHRHALKPGITGLAQVRGLRGATLTGDDLRRRLQADLEYLNNWSLMLDLWIMLATVRVLVHRNAY